MKNKKLIHRGSVKNIYEYSSEELAMNFSDRYSVFDWGEMPDAIPNKGEALAFMGAYFFEHLGDPETWSNWNCGPASPETKSKLYQSRTLNKIKSWGVLNHFRGQLDHNTLIAKQVNVPKLSQMGVYQTRPVQTLVPLEVVFRFGCPRGSSLLDRIQDPKYREQMGLKRQYAEDEWFDDPIVEFFTKLEPSDRYLTYSEAKSLAGLSQIELSKLIELTQILALELFNVFKSINVDLWDGKFEFAFEATTQGREFLLVDSIGPDELRLSFEKQRLSKEYLRQCYKETQWYRELDRTKKKAPTSWKEQMKSQSNHPPQLPSEKISHFQDMYLGLANALADRKRIQRPFSGRFQMNKLKEKS